MVFEKVFKIYSHCVIMNKSRIGLFSYDDGFKTELAKQAAEFLRDRGYDAECVEDITKLESFGVALIHPG